MDITKIYTKTMHKALQNAIKQGFRIDYEPSGGFIKRVYNTKQGVIYRYHTIILITSAVTAESFLKIEYEQAIKNLEKIYQHCISDNTYQLENEFYQDRYSTTF